MAMTDGKSLEDIPTGRFVSKGLAAYPRRGVKEGVKGQYYGLSFEGFLDVPRDGVYIFYTRIDGNYKLQIGGKDRIVRDRNEGTREHTAVVALAKGLVPFKLSHLAANPIRDNFDLEWEGPGIRTPTHAFQCVQSHRPGPNAPGRTEVSDRRKWKTSGEGRRGSPRA